MCEHAARSLLSSDDGGNVSVRTLFKLLDENAEFVVDALGTLPVSLFTDINPIQR